MVIVALVVVLISLIILRGIVVLVPAAARAGRRVRA